MCKKELPKFYTVKQAAKITGWSIPTIRNRIREIPKQLKDSYVQRIDGYNNKPQTYICEHQVNLWAAEKQEKISKKEPPIVVYPYKEEREEQMKEEEVKDVKSDSRITTFTDKKLGSIRAMEIDNEPWFVGKDVAQALGYVDTDKAIRKHVDEDDKLTRQIGGSGQKREMTIINESGLYSLILSSKLPQAKEFKRWVTAEVLPSIRKHGGYIEGQETLSDDELIAKALIVAQSKIEEKNKQISEMQPKVEYLDSIVASDKTMKVTEIAKYYGMSARLFNSLLHECGIQYKSCGLWNLYEKYQDKGYALVVTGFNRFGEPYQSLEWTQKGKTFVYNELAGRGINPLSMN